MTLIIKNTSNHTIQVRYFNSNRYATLEPNDTVVMSNVPANRLSSYQNLKGLSVRVKGSPTDLNRGLSTAKSNSNVIKTVSDKPVEESKPEVTEPVIEETEEPYTPDLTQYTDEELKVILKNMGINTRYRLREKLEGQILENLPDDKKVEDYL